MSTVTFNNRRFESPQECSICITPTTNGVVDQHGHVFHERCLRTWTARSSTCPQCRRQVTAINGVAVRRIRQLTLPANLPMDLRENGSLSQSIGMLVATVVLGPLIIICIYVALPIFFVLSVASAIASVVASLRASLRRRIH